MLVQATLKWVLNHVDLFFGLSCEQYTNKNMSCRPESSSLSRPPHKMKVTDSILGSDTKNLHLWFFNVFSSKHLDKKNSSGVDMIIKNFIQLNLFC